MIWFDSKYDLQYYNQPEGVECYCEALIKPSDMILQGMLPAVPGNSYTMHIDVYSADGNTFYESANTYFSYFFGGIADGRRYFNAQLKGYSPGMCSHECFVLNVYVTNAAGGQVFNKWTERYCIANCCDEVTSIDFTQTEVVSPYGPQPYTITPYNPVVPTKPNNPSNNCGEAYITITSYFDCNDKFTGEYYGDPQTVYSGTAFKFKKVTNLKGAIRTLPREIIRQYSLNCKLQKVESVTEYQLLGFEIFAVWKMREIEGQLHANHIAINNYNGINRNVEFKGGTPFQLLRVGYNCDPFYKLDVTLNDCSVNQIFGCGDKCNTEGSAPMGMVVPAIQGAVQYYDENKNYLGATAEELINYYATRPGVENVEVLNTEDYDCSFETAFIVYGTEYIPTSVYVNGTRQSNRIFGQSLTAMSELCGLIKPACATPYIGTIFMEDNICATPVIGVWFSEAYPEETLYLTGLGDWELVADQSLATRSQNVITLKFDVFNENYTYDSSDPDAEIPVISDNVAYVSTAGWPKEVKTFTNASIDSIPVDGILTIDTNGQIYYSGPVTAADLTGSHIQITNITYTI